MKKQTLFEKYYNRLFKEGVIKSLLCGLGAASCALFLISFIFWMFGIKGYYIAIIVWAVAFVGATCAFYFLKFRPTTREIARRVDKLGLEERLITMLELEGDDSFIAMKQREDAKKAMASVNASLLKIVVSAPLIIAACSISVLGMGMTTLSALTEKGVVKPGIDIIGDKPVEFVDVIYSVKDDEGGYIYGDFIQRIEKGGNAEAVRAEADEGFVFVKWSDGNEDPFRQDMKITADMEIVAIFQSITEDSDGDGDGGGEPGDEPGQEEGEPGGKSDPSNGSGSSGSGGAKWNPRNQILDNNTYYGDLFDDAKKTGMDKISQDGSMPDSAKDLVSGYYGSTEPKDENAGG